MRGQRPADEPDPPPDRHDPTEHVVPVPRVQGALVQVVDLALDHLGELVVPDDDLVDEAREEVASVEGAEAGLAIEGVDEALKRRDRAGVDREDDVLFRDEIDLSPRQTGRLVVCRLQRLEGQVYSVLGAGQLGATPLRCESFPVSLGEVQQVRDVAQGGVVPPVDVDPQELVLPSLATSMSARSIAWSWPSASNSRAATGSVDQGEQCRRDHRDDGCQVLEDQHRPIRCRIGLVDGEWLVRPIGKHRCLGPRV